MEISINSEINIKENSKKNIKSSNRKIDYNKIKQAMIESYQKEINI